MMRMRYLIMAVLGAGLVVGSSFAAAYWFGRQSNTSAEPAETATATPAEAPQPTAGPTPIRDLSRGIAPPEPCTPTKHYEDLQEALQAPQSVCIMTLSEPGLRDIPPEIGQLKRMTVLNIVGTGITTLPPEIGELTNLQFLLLSSNQLTSIPEEIKQLQYLVQLDLSENPLPEEERQRITELLPDVNLIF